MITLVIGIIGLINIKDYDRYSGEIEIKNAYVSRVSGSINDANVTSSSTIKSTDEVMYEINYTITGDETRSVNIKASLSEEEAKYASFEKIDTDNITSVLSEDRKEITITVKNAKPKKDGKQQIF